MSINSILVVDDDPETLKAMRQVLEPLGYAISIATDGHKAIQLLNQEAVDLVITDLLMPQGDGFELIAALRKNFPNTDIVAISGGGHVGADTYLMIARGFGVDVVLQKPVTRDK